MDWKQENTTFIEPAAVKRIAEACGVSEPFARVLIRRGIDTPEKAEPFLHPEKALLPSPEILTDLMPAAEAIQSAVRAGKKICVYGDYDVDGICATTILYRALRRIGAEVSYYIPHRAREGYGMHEQSVRTLAEQGVALLITVDNGISAHAEIDLAHSLGMEVIVTDHHRCHETLPDARYVVCATREGQDPEAATLCGASVAMLLATALGLPKAKSLGLAALATVADVMPMRFYNRAIVAQGMRMILEEEGIVSLLENANLTKWEINETTLSFILAPRLNAAGRMGDAQRAVRLFTEDDPYVIRSIARELEDANEARKLEEQRILAEAEAGIDPKKDHVLLMLRGDDWNPGVIGIVASKLLEKYHCPVLLFSGKSGELKGSGRSIPEVDLFELLSRHASFFTQYGGHLLAAGASIEMEQFEACREAMTRYLAEQFPDGIPKAAALYEETLPVSACTVDFCRELALLSPFGEENREPVFRIAGSLYGVTAMGKDGSHLSAWLEDGGQRLRLVGFRIGERIRSLSKLDRAETLCTLKLNTFREHTSVNGYLSGIREERQGSIASYAMDFVRMPSAENAKALADCSNIRLDENRIRELFRYYRLDLNRGIEPEELTEEALLSFLVLYEAGVLRYAAGRFFEVPVKEKKQIANGNLYSRIHS